MPGVCPCSVQFCSSFWVITFIEKEEENIFFYFNHVEISKQFSRKASLFLFFTEQFQDDGYFCKKYFFISIFCLVMASSAAVVNLVSLFNLPACFTLINFPIKFSVANVSRKDWYKLKIKFLLQIAVINGQIKTAAITLYLVGVQNKTTSGFCFFFLYDP